jgi:hypothetical protein
MLAVLDTLTEDVSADEYQNQPTLETIEFWYHCQIIIFNM